MSSATPAPRITVLSLNCWGVPVVAKNRVERIGAIADNLIHSDVDIVGLQEIWFRDDYALICNLVEHVFPYFYYFRSGIIGSGLAVLSRYPILEVSIKRFSANGKPQKFYHGDWLGGKAVGLCRIRHPLGIVDFYNTHLHACYVKKQEDDEYAAHRIAQAWELVQFVRHTSRYHVIVVGDMNCDPSSLGYSLFTTPTDKYGGGGVTDTWIETLNTKEKLQLMDAAVRRELMISSQASCDNAGSRNSKESIYRDCLRGATCHAYSNSFFNHPDPEDSERIDYVFYRPTSGMSLDFAQLSMVNHIPNGTCSFSDHYGMKAYFLIQQIEMKASIFKMPTTIENVERTNESIENDGFTYSNSPSPSRPHIPTLWERSMLPLHNSVSHASLPLLSELDNVPDSNLLPAVISLMTAGIRDARHRMKSHAIWSTVCGLLWFAWIVYYIVSLSMFKSHAIEDTLTNVFSWIWLIGGILSQVIVFIFIYNLVMQRFVLPEELAALERIRSEVVVWVQGHSRWAGNMSKAGSPVNLQQHSITSPHGTYPGEEMGRKDYKVVMFCDIDADAVLDKPVVERVLRIAGVWIEDNANFDSQQQSSPHGYPIGGGMQHVTGATLQPQSTDNLVRPSHARRPSNMADPGPASSNAEMVTTFSTLGALSIALSSQRNQDHPSNLIQAPDMAATGEAMRGAVEGARGAMEGALQNVKNQTMRVRDQLQQRRNTDVTAAPSSVLPTEDFTTGQ